MTEIKEILVPGYEKVIEATNESQGLHCFIAIHNTTMGPAVGGTRIYPYADRESALNDVLRLAKAMTYKSAVAEDGLGGGKAVIIADPQKNKTKALLLAFGEVVETLKGTYIAAEDVGSTTEDIAIINHVTGYVAALATDESSGDPSRFTAWGVFQGLRAVATKLWGNPSLHGKKIAIQGLGSVGAKLARLLFWNGAELSVCDLLEERVHDLAIRYGGHQIEVSDFASTPCDILCPCAMGDIINHTTIQKLQCKAIAGSANNQLEENHFGKDLMEQGILYAPDYVINAGGIINAASEFDPGGYDPKTSRDKVVKIYDTLLEIFSLSDRDKKPTSVVADELAMHKLERKIGKRKTPLVFHGKGQP